MGIAYGASPWPVPDAYALPARACSMAGMSVRAETKQPFRLRDLTFSVYVPTMLFSIGQGAVIPIIPLFARDLGASVAFASLIVAMRGLGQLIFDMPAGIAVSRWGDKGAMVAGTAMIGLVAVGAAFSPSPVVLEKEVRWDRLDESTVKGRG